ncbi:MAG: TonB family protein, partial [Bacteroidales bacterium]|nr:TonB family protein [Bacteroidales bacterium]
MLGVIDVVEHPAEIWVYVPFGIRKMTIQHPQLGILRDYQFPCAIEKGRTYIMKLTAGNVRTIVEHAVTRQFLYIELDPSDAILEINGKIKATDNGVYQELMQFGKYTYKAYSQNYHDLVGMVEISDPVNTHSLTLKLKAAFGHLSVLPTAQQDLSGAAVYVDDKYIGQVPIRDLQLSSGSHSIRIIKEMYEAYNETFTIKDEEKKILTPKLVSDFAEVTLVTGNDADIYINGERKGKHTWTGRLASGSYLLESRQTGHVSFQMPYDFSRKDHGQTIRIQDPTPVYGSLVISSTPAKARITIDGEYVGETPKFIPNQLIGQHTIVAEKEGYEKQTKKIEVTEGAEASLSFTLETKKVAVNSSENPKVPAEIITDNEEAIPFQLVEEKPSFQGGDANQFSKWVNQRLVYPDIARENGVQGRVTLQFTIRKDGSLTNVKVIRGLDPALDKEAVRVVSMSPKWTPGMLNGRVVAVIYTFPVIFRLQ